MKPVVNYDPRMGADFFFYQNHEHYGFEDDGPILVGSVYGLNHPKLATDRIRTSRIILLDPMTGVFETLNTVYVPAYPSREVI